MSPQPILSDMKELRHIVLLVCVLAGGCATTASTDGPPAAVSFEAPADTSTASTVAETHDDSQGTATANTSSETSTTSSTTAVPLVETQDPTETNPETVDPFEQLLTGLVYDRGLQERGDWAAPEFERAPCAPLTETGPALELAEASRDSVACYPTHWWTQDQTQLPELDQDQIEALGDNYETLLEPDNPNQFFEEFEPKPLDQQAEFYALTVVPEGVTTEDLATADSDAEARPFDPCLLYTSPSPRDS